MKYFLLLSLSLLSTISFAKDTAQLEPFCRVTFVENGKAESIDFKFKCDNYGEGATFESKSKRFLATAFSEESCTPQLVLYDSKTKTSSASVIMDESANGFAVFKDKLVIAALNTEVERDQVLDDRSENRAIMICSTNKDLLEELE